MIRPMRDEVKRYGNYSLAAESMYDHPFQWGPNAPGRIWRALAGGIPTNGDSLGYVDGLLERYPGAQVRNFNGLPETTEMDALIAYLQTLGTLVDFSTFTPDPSR